MHHFETLLACICRKSEEFYDNLENFLPHSPKTLVSLFWNSIKVILGLLLHITFNVRFNVIQSQSANHLQGIL